ncbi:hypothetical protein [Chryseobacterium sp. MDT2-18]|uniref:hypothetical protein n=1 Tax=Chryseobacterium sp. MDT2-18 TaxID=1259136 RepID=UPI0027817A7F|nr:hypothetical protein [Chryseobacterium sp. MDT2-18]MDQ0477481.1 hypothetical protein [Chryseobacterium sp. MDT2-18]
MKKLILISFLALIGCSKQNKNSPFVHEETYNVIDNSIREMKNDKQTANDSIYYLFQRNDSLIVVSLDKEKFKVTTNAKKIGYFKINSNRIVITEETTPNYKIFELKKALKPFQIRINDNDNFSPDYLKGIVYKITSHDEKYFFEKKYKGDLSKIFKNKIEYTIPIIENIVK